MLEVEKRRQERYMYIGDRNRMVEENIKKNIKNTEYIEYEMKKLRKDSVKTKQLRWNGMPKIIPAHLSL